MSRSRNFCFTLNNYTDVELQSIQSVDCTYMVIGKEVGASGTAHLQGYVYFPLQKTPSAVKKLLGQRCHIEIAKGSHKQASDYCKKDDPNPFEKGSMPIGAVGKSCTIEERMEYNKRLRDCSLNDLVDSGEINIKEVRALKNARIDLAQESAHYQHDDVRGVWYWGPPGTGKSRKAHEENPGAYIKSQNKWWDNYRGEKVVLLDDLDTDTLGHYLKIWADRYACTGEVKGGTVNLVHEKIIITSNYSIEELFENRHMQEAIRRRFEVHHFSQPFKYLQQ